VGQVKQALEENKVAEDLDPVSPYMIIGTARTLLFLDRNDEAIAHIAKALLLDPNFGGAHQLLGVAYVQKKMYPEAINELKIAQHEMGQDPARIGRLGYAYAASGQTAEARAILNGLLSESRPAPARAVSLIYVGLGDKDHAFQYLREVVNRPGSSLMLKADPVYSSLRTDPRYRELLESIGLQ
jgi:Flp pilus assembly protein TadD